MDGVGQTGSDRQGDHADDGGINGHPSPWTPHRTQEWSSAGAALEPAFETLSPWSATHPDRRGIEALSGGDNPDDAMSSTLVQPRFSTFSALRDSLADSLGDSLGDSLDDPLGDSLGGALSSPLSVEDPYADELAQRSAEFARHAALDDPTPAQGLPHMGPPPIAWTTPDPDPPLAQMTLGQRFGIAFPPAADAQPATDPDPTGGYPRLTGEWRSAAPQASAGGDAPTAERFPSGFTTATPSYPAPDAYPRSTSLSQPDSDLSYDDEELDEREDRFGRELFRRDSPFTRDAFKRDNPFGVDDETGEDLPQRIPAEPDVPRRDEVLADASLEDKEAQLTRIASHLRRDDVPSERPDGFDVEAVLEAVRGVAGVREATLRTTSTGARHLRLELSEGADPGTISRMVARMLQDQMGINAALTGNAWGANQSGPLIPGQAEPSGDGNPPVVLPGPRTGLGAAPPPAVENPPSLRDRMMGARDTRRRHPVSVPRRPPSELRPSERAAAAWRAAGEGDPSSMPPPIPTDRDQGPRAIVDHVQTSTFGLDATVEVRLTLGDKEAVGVASGPAVDAYILRLSAGATAAAIDELLRDGTTIGEAGRCFVEHAAIVPMGSCDVAVVVVLLMCGGWVEQLAGSALVSGDPRRAVVRATLSAVNRRLAALLP